MPPSDYYSRPPRPQQQPDGLYQSYNPSAPSIAPSYHTTAPSRTPSRPQETNDPVSPFEAPFDDHVYPARPGQGGKQYDSQSTLGSDTRYYGQGGGGRLEQSPSFQDNIPLRDHPGMPGKDNISTDHVYDAPQPSRLEAGEAGRPSRFTRMLKNPKGRIPWLVYILTTIQVAVFIVEIVKNGMYITRGAWDAG